MIDFIFLFIISNSIFLGFLFFLVKSENKRANIFLGLFFLSIAVHLYNDILAETFIYESNGSFYFLFEPLLLTIPFLLFYVLHTINDKIKTYHYLTFIPGIGHNFLLYSGDNLLSENGLTIFETIFYYLSIFLLIIILKILYVHKKKVFNFYSDTEKKLLTWLNGFFQIIFLIFALIIISDISEAFSGNFEWLQLTIPITCSFLMIFGLFWTAYYGLTQPKIFTEYSLSTSNNKFQIDTFKGTNIKHKTIVNIQPDQIKKDSVIFNEIKNQIQNKELYLDPKLSLPALAKILNYKDKDLSRIINTCGDLNFYQFINQFRIEKFKTLLNSKKTDQLSIMGLASESGFATKSTFYKSFKEIEGITPTEYLKSINKSE